MIKTEKGTVSFRGDGAEIMEDFCIVTNSLCKILQEHEDMEREKAEETIRKYIDIAFSSEEDPDKELEEIKQKMQRIVSDKLKEFLDIKEDSAHD